MKIKDFVQGRNVSYDTVRKYITNHPKTFSGHIGKSNNIILDDYAVELLDKKYPFPEPVQVIQDTAARDELLELHKKYALAMEKITALTEQNANLLVVKSKQLFLEEENKNLSEKLNEREEQLQNLKIELEQQKNSYKFLQGQLETAKVNYQLEKNKTWWDKLRGR